jgi:hypothetical protein
MKRLFLFSVLSGLTMAGIFTSEAAQVTRGPYLQSAADDRMILCWRTDVETTSEIMFGTSPDALSSTAVDPGSRTDHAIALTGLLPATRYYYRVKGTPVSGTSVDLGGANHWFDTAPTDGTAESTRIWVVGDSGYGYPQPVNSYNTYMSLTSVEGKKTDAFLMLGDNAYDIGTDNQYQWFVFNRYANLLRNTPVWSAFGNHDAYTAPSPYTALVPYDAIFRFPTNAECGGFASGSERFYSFNHGNIHFICLDTNTLGNYDDVPGGTYGMVDWLLDDLKACDSDWIVAFMHLGPYSRGSYNSDVSGGFVYTRYHVVPLLESYGVDLVLYGHSHVYERSGLIDGHYGVSSTFNPATMRKWPGNGSESGYVDAAGYFVANPSAAGGAYQKPSSTARAGTVYSVVGASSAPSGTWIGGSTNIVNPTPHVVHETSLRLVGGLVLDIEGNRLNGRYIGEHGAKHDDFTILKGATYTLHPAVPTVENNVQGIAFPVTRSGSNAFAEQVPVAVEVISGNGTLSAQAIAEFNPGQDGTMVKFFPPTGSSALRFKTRLLPTMRSVQPGAAPRQAYRISGGEQTGQFAGTPAATWYASRFGSEPADSSVWNTDDDSDGLSLLLEYALGGVPGGNDANLLPQGKIESGAYVFRFMRPLGRDDLTYEVLASPDLASWPQPGPADVNDGPVTALGEPRKVELPLNSGLKFVRMKVELQP